MSESQGKNGSLKEGNKKALWFLMCVDIFALVIISKIDVNLKDGFHGILSPNVLFGAASVAIGPFVVIFLNSLISSQYKSVIVFWRNEHALPGHRAFSKYAKSDPRFDIEILRNNVGEFPDDPKAQNVLWYKLLKKHESSQMVSEAHSLYLLFRDGAVLTLILAGSVLIVLIFINFELDIIIKSLGFLLVQFFGLVLSARNMGGGLVRNVLALEAIHTPEGQQ